ncbi:MAG: ornithine cyclodeaminase family protein [Chloroflexi bacterium]|nr:MAG: ornithine cyclodeaminase family protein [Chloroflexota bacterium]TME54103.1 MAG: ornithine cyclodeaminase family protein [Chloroflexota bacterium]
MSRLQLRFISGPDVASLGLTRAEIFGAVTDAVRAQGEGSVVLEPRVHLNPRKDGRGHFNVLRAHLGTENVSGIKVVGDFVDNHLHGLPSELALITLYDGDTGAPLAIVDGTMITAARTGAMTALGAQHLARRDSRILGHVGARGTAWWNVTMLDDLFDFEEIRVTSLRPDSREEFARRLSKELGKPVRATVTPEEALEGADIMVEASRLTAPAVLLRTSWVALGTLVIPYGTISAVELSLTDVMDKVVVDDWGQATVGPFGALRAHVDQGLLTRERIHAELGEIVAGKRPGRERADERILFWHRGLATTDVAVAHLVWRRAEAIGAGTVLTYRDEL